MAKAQKKLERACTMCGEPDEILVLDMCRPCYAYCHYWQKRTLAEKMHRVDNLKKYAHRMSVITGSSGRHLKLASSSKEIKKKKPEE